MSEDGGAAITALRSELLLQLGEMRGDIRLILQAQQHQADRNEETRQAYLGLDGRVDALERTTVTRAELEQAVTQAREDAKADLKRERDATDQQRATDQRRADRKLTAIGIALGVVTALLSIAVAGIGIFVR